MSKKYNLCLQNVVKWKYKVAKKKWKYSSKGQGPQNCPEVHSFTKCNLVTGHSAVVINKRKSKLKQVYMTKIYLLLILTTLLQIPFDLYAEVCM